MNKRRRFKAKRARYIAKIYRIIAEADTYERWIINRGTWKPKLRRMGLTL